MGKRGIQGRYTPVYGRVKPEVWLWDEDTVKELEKKVKQLQNAAKKTDTEKRTRVETISDKEETEDRRAEGDS